jgi:hypothetical protein
LTAREALNHTATVRRTLPLAFTGLALVACTWVTSADPPPELPAGMMLAYLLAPSVERARILGVLYEKRPEMADLLAELEADEDLRARFEMALLQDER